MENAYPPILIQYPCPYHTINATDPNLQYIPIQHRATKRKAKHVAEKKDLVI